MKPQFALWLLLALLALAGCELGREPELLQILAVTPDQVSTGDRIDIVGNGFPAGKRATVVFEGVVRRPGMDDESIRVSAEGTSPTRDRVSMSMDQELERRFCGDGDRASHATFMGDVRVSFAPRDPGAPTVSGTLRGAVLDVVPSWVERETFERRRSEARAAMAFMGFRATRTQQTSGLIVDAVERGGRAEVAGLRGNDVVVAFDGVSVLGMSDLRPGRGHSHAMLRVRRDGYDDPLALRVALDGYRVVGAADLVPAAALVGVVCALLLVSLSPFGRVLSWVERRLRSRARTIPRRRRLSWLASDLLSGTRHGRWVRQVCFLAVLALLTASALGLPGTRHLPDMAIGYGMGAALLVIGRLVAGGRGGSTWSLRGGLRATVQTAGLVLAGLVSVLAIFWDSGAASAAELVRGQGAWPWEWGAFRDPGSALLATVLLASAVPVAAPTGLAASTGRTPASPPTAFAAEALFSSLTAGVVTVALLGGWQLPGIGLDEQRLSMGLQLAGACVLWLKLSVVAVTIRSARRLVGGAPLSTIAGLGWSRLLPAALLGAAIAARWEALFDAAAAADLIDAVPPLLLGFFVAQLFVLGRRIVGALHGPDAPASVNPWL